MSSLNLRLQRIQSFIKDAPKQMGEKFRSETPIRSGNARRKTDIRGNEIQANYDYSIRLEKEGWSRQAPQGMSKPTIDWIQGRFRGL